MGVYIKGFKPQDGLYVIKDGVIRKYKGKGGTVRPYELIDVKEPHGRLIDADEIVKDLRHDVAVDQDMLDYEELTDVIRETTQVDKDIKQNAAEIIESTPTVIEQICEVNRMDDLISRFRDYQIEWLTAHNDIEFCEEEEKLIIGFLKDTAESFMRENQSAKMDDLISRQDAIEALIQEFYSNVDDYISEKQAVHAIDSLPSVQSERKKGKWILTEDDNYEYCTCSECGYQNGENWINGSDIPFCAVCGADMRGENYDKG